jgi:integrase
MKCPECDSSRVVRAGVRYDVQGLTVQRWICRSCSRRFSERKQLSNRLSDKFLMGMSAFPDSNLRTKNMPGRALLLETETKKESSPVGIANQINVRTTIFDYSWYLKKEGFSESTIMSRTRLLRILMKRNGDLTDPESIKGTIAKQPWCPGRKGNAVDAYSSYLKMVGGKWQPPFYRAVSKIPFVPTPGEVDILVACCSKRMGSFLQVIAETGARPGEIWRLPWADVDLVTKTVRITPEKGSNPRISHVSTKLIEMLDGLARGYGDRVFSRPGMRLDNHSTNFRNQRNRAAQKIKNPRLKQISFKTLRHFKGTWEYHRTKDILHVMNVLGHKNIKNTLVYTHLAEELFKGEQEYVSRVARTQKDACGLIDAGFEFVCDWNGQKIFRKRKY